MSFPLFVLTQVVHCNSPVRSYTEATTVSSKGRITIPKAVRIALQLKAGSKVEFVFDGKRAILVPAGGVAHLLAGSLRAYAKRFRRTPL